jgi:hypothetical protein
MPAKGRPRLTPADLEARIKDYCDRYGVSARTDGLPPFPTGQRETRQHRDWIAVYKAHDRLARRARGQCERCAAPATDDSVFCEDHRSAPSARASRSAGPSLAQRKALLETQKGRCPVCGKAVELRDAVDHEDPADGLRAVLHPGCGRLVGLAERIGPSGLERLRAYLWPEGLPRRRR